MPIEEVTKQSISASMLMTLSDKENQKKPEGNNFELTNVMNKMETIKIELLSNTLKPLFITKNR